MRGAAGGRKSLNRRVSEPDFGKKALPVTQNFQPGKVREVVADWNKVSRTEAVNHDCPIKSILFSSNQNIIWAQIRERNSVAIEITMEIFK